MNGWKMGGSIEKGEIAWELNEGKGMDQDAQINNSKKKPPKRRSTFPFYVTINDHNQIKNILVQ
jgi:hypothetical protein